MTVDQVPIPKQNIFKYYVIILVFDPTLPLKVSSASAVEAGPIAPLTHSCIVSIYKSFSDQAKIQIYKNILTET